jgi:hypothetical protein
MMCGHSQRAINVMWHKFLLTDEDVIRLWTGASNLEELHQVKELAMDITANLFQIHKIG